MRKYLMLFIAMIMAAVVLAPSAGANAEERIDEARIEKPRVLSAESREAAAAPNVKPVVGSYSRISIHGRLNFRAGPGFNHDIIGKLDKGFVVKVLSGPHNTNWYKLMYRTRIGYSHVSGLSHVGLAGQALAKGHAGKLIVISRKRQQLEAYNDGKLYLVTAVTTGRPDLDTPLGSFEVLDKVSPKQMKSPWPKGHKYYYDPAWVKYAILFEWGGFFIHDAPWAPYNGYGTNVPHEDPDGVWRTGSHGCVRTPLWAVTNLYSWSRIGTTNVKVVGY